MKEERDVKSLWKRSLAVLLSASMLCSLTVPALGAEREPDTRYQISPDYAARYPNGVFEFGASHAQFGEI